MSARITVTDEMIEQGREALTFGIMGCGQCCGDNPPDELDHLDHDVARAHVAARAALEAAAPLIAAQALEAARGPYRCCPHCADDIIHDVEKDDHTVPCHICQNDEIRRAKAEALREAAEEFWARLPDGTGNGRAYNSHRVADMLRARADRIEGGQP